MQGFVYSATLTDDFRKVAQLSQKDGFNSQHLWVHGMVFLNPKVSSKYEHAHLMGDPGCYFRSEGVFPCGTTPGGDSMKKRNDNG
jgi:hypothetical protein